MRKFLNVSLLLLAVGLAGSAAGCGGWLAPEKPVAAEPGLSAGDYLESRTTGSQDDFGVGSAAQPATPARTTPAVTASATGVRPEMVAVSESGSSVVSKTYPWAECGVVQLDKTMPSEVGLNKPFSYNIKISNLTNATLNDIIVTEDLPDNFKFLSANPSAQQDDDNVIFWEIATLGPKSVTQIQVSGQAAGRG